MVLMTDGHCKGDWKTQCKLCHTSTADNQL